MNKSSELLDHLMDSFFDIFLESGNIQCIFHDVGQHPVCKIARQINVIGTASNFLYRSNNRVDNKSGPIAQSILNFANISLTNRIRIGRKPYCSLTDYGPSQINTDRARKGAVCKRTRKVCETIYVSTSKLDRPPS